MRQVADRITLDWRRAGLDPRRSAICAFAEQLTRALVDKMVDARELCIRVLTEGAGDKAAMHAMNVGIVSLLMGRCFGFSAEDRDGALGSG